MAMRNPRNTQTSEPCRGYPFLIVPLLKAFFSTRIQQIQADMTYRALELLSMPPDQPAFLLDIGCGSGLSGEILDDEGYIWAGVDIAPSMLGELHPFILALWREE